MGDSELSHKISQGRNEVLIKKARVLCKWLVHEGRQPNEGARSGRGVFMHRQLAPRKVRSRRARERNPSDWQLCPLVTVWLSPKLLYFTEIMIFYGHRFEDNCCILRVVLQGDELLPCEEVRGGLLCFFLPFLTSSPECFITRMMVLRVMTWTAPVLINPALLLVFSQLSYLVFQAFQNILTRLRLFLFVRLKLAYTWSRERFLLTAPRN